MSLDPQSALDSIASSIQEAAGLDSNFDPILDSNGKPISPPTSNTFSSDFAEAYNSFVSNAVIPGTINEGGDITLIENALENDSNTEGAVDDFAEALALFWSEVAVTPGDPAFGGTSVIAVENDAATKVSDFKNAILESRTDEELENPYSGLFTETENVLASIIWLVTETKSDGSVVVHESAIS